MKILVTGSNGCVGSALKNLIYNRSYSTEINIDLDGSAPKQKVRKSLLYQGIARRANIADHWQFISRTDCDLTNRDTTIDFFKEAKPDVVIHLASYVPGFYNVRPVDSFSYNVRLNENALQASHEAGVERGLFALSVNMFPENPQAGFPIKEFSILEGSLSGPSRGYGFSKKMLALSLENYNEQYNTRYVGLIPTNIYGPNDNLSSGRLIPNLIQKFQQAVKDNTDEVVINGSGKPLRQFIYSTDLAIIIKHLVEFYQDTKPIICSSDEEVSIAELAKMIAEATGFKGEIKFDISKPDGVLKKTVSNEYLKSIIPDLAFTSLKDGIKSIAFNKD